MKLNHGEDVGLTDFKLFLGSESVVDLGDTEVLSVAHQSEVISAKEAENVEMPAGFLHAYANPYKFDVYLLGTRTSQVKETAADREQNIERIFDQARRYNLPTYPDDMIRRLYTD